MDGRRGIRLHRRERRPPLKHSGEAKHPAMGTVIITVPFCVVHMCPTDVVVLSPTVAGSPKSDWKAASSMVPPS